MDPLSRLAMHRAAAAAVDVEAQLSIKEGCRPIVLMLQRAKMDAATALAALTDANPEDPMLIRKLQNDVRRYEDIYRWLGDVVSVGREAESQISDEDRDEMIEILGETVEGREELIQLGIIEGDQR